METQEADLAKVLEAITNYPGLNATEHIRRGHFNKKEARALFRLERTGMITYSVFEEFEGWYRLDDD